MIAKSAGFFLTAVIAFAQTDRVFHFEHTSQAPEMGEIATAVRTIADISSVSLDEEKQALTLRGSAEQLTLAEWMFNELDAPNPKSEAVHQYKMPSGDENAVRIFYLNYTPTIQDFQEVATATRTVAGIRRVFTYNAPRAMIARGTPDQIALAAWIVGQLDPARNGKSAEYRLPATADPRGDVVIRVMYTQNAETIQEFQEIATAVRTIADIRRVFTYNRPRAILVRADAQSIALAQWLLEQFDKPPAATTSAPQSSTVYEFDTSSDPDNTVRVFYTPQFATVREFQRFATRVRTTAGLRRVFTYNEPRAIAVRGTVIQVQTAERIVSELDPPKPVQ